jgi:hypothetical protein
MDRDAHPLDPDVSRVESSAASSPIRQRPGLSVRHLIENYLIAPRVYGNRLKLSNVAVILAFAVGAPVAGMLGVVIALPIAAAYPRSSASGCATGWRRTRCSNTALSSAGPASVGIKPRCEADLAYRPLRARERVRRFEPARQLAIHVGPAFRGKPRDATGSSRSATRLAKRRLGMPCADFQREDQRRSPHGDAGRTPFRARGESTFSSDPP